jgi:hypothetical protein
MHRMTEYTQLSFSFASISGKKVIADFSGEQVTSDAGVLLLREVAKRTGLIDRLVDVIDDSRHPSYITHSLRDLLAQRIFQIACGYEDALDANALRVDPAFKAACDRLPSEENLASQSTLSRLENARTSKDLRRLGDALVDCFIASYQIPPEHLVLDLDDTEDPTHGAQQLSLFNGYYDTFCFQPLVIFEGKSGKLITAILRPGKRPTGREIRSILKRVVARIRNVWPTVPIVVRGDSHYAAPEVFSWCDAHHIRFIFGLTRNSVLARRMDELSHLAQRRYEIFKTKDRCFTEFEYQARLWHRKLRIIGMAEMSELGLNTRFVVTNILNLRPVTIYEVAYCGRGQMENFIKELKLGLKCDRTSCHTFFANTFRLFLHSFAYSLLHAFRDTLLVDTAFASAQFDTIRLRFLKIGAAVREWKTRIQFRLPQSYPLKNLFVLMHDRLALLM